MFKPERLSTIKEILLRDRQVSVAYLAKELGTTTVTIRSDLEQLEKSDFLTRIHGGAILKNPEAESTVPLVQNQANTILFPPLPVLCDAKIRIAKEAASYIKDHEWIFLDSGSTCSAIAQQLVNKTVNVITDNIVAAYILSQNKNIHIVVPGGVLEACSFPFLYGEMLVENLRSMHIDKSFISVAAAHIKFGYSVSHPQEGNLLDVLREHSDELVMVSDSSKFGKSSFRQIGGLDCVDTVISDTALPEEYVSYYKEHKVNLLLA